MTGILASVDQRTQLAGHNRLELLLFRTDSRQQYGINVFKVQEVIQCPPLTHVPHSHPVIRGIAKLRGKTIPVMDLAMAIGKPPVDDVQDKFVIITEYNRSVQGFLVGSVQRIVNMNWADILPPPQGTGKNSYMTAVTKIDDELVEIIDVEKVLAEVTGGEAELSGELLASSDREADVPRQVLVVDDSSVARNQIKRTLEQLGVECVLKRDGRQALEQLKAWADEGTPLDERLLMIVSDIEMPEMDGYTLTREIRGDERLKDAFVLLHTSLSGVFNNAMVERVGANQFIAKFNPDLLGGAVLDRIKAVRDARHAA
ncbi:MAG TPA: chemotaxis protein CheV [Gammaproteobacteria bacterium]|nr:chemotaxis protein CheV [Gammaproteobacteria bacterium]